MPSVRRAWLEGRVPAHLVYPFRHVPAAEYACQVAKLWKSRMKADTAFAEKYPEVTAQVFVEDTWQEQAEVHPLASAFRELNSKERAMLAESLATGVWQHGSKLAFYEGKLLDGRARRDALVELYDGHTAPFVDIETEAEARAWLLQHNGFRSRLTREQVEAGRRTLTGQLETCEVARYVYAKKGARRHLSRAEKKRAMQALFPDGKPEGG